MSTVFVRDYRHHHFKDLEEDSAKERSISKVLDFLDGCGRAGMNSLQNDNDKIPTPPITAVNHLPLPLLEIDSLNDQLGPDESASQAAETVTSVTAPPSEIAAAMKMFGSTIVWITRPLTTANLKKPRKTRQLPDLLLLTVYSQLRMVIPPL
jgi:hypothetical protein